jgi:deoxyribonuclease NucA/NucB
VACAAVVAGLAVPAAAGAAVPVPGPLSGWHAVGPGRTSFGWIVNRDGTMLAIVGGIYKPDPLEPPVLYPDGMCGLGVGAGDPGRTPVVHRRFAVTVLGDGGYPATFTGTYTSAYTAHGTYAFSYDCTKPGPGPIRQRWVAFCIDKCLPPPPERKPLPPPSGNGAVEPVRPGQRVHGELCVTAVDGQRLRGGRRTLCGPAPARSLPVSSGALRGGGRGELGAIRAQGQCGDQAYGRPVLESRSAWCRDNVFEVAHYELSGSHRRRVGVAIVRVGESVKTRLHAGQRLEHVGAVGITASVDAASGTLRKRELELRLAVRCAFAGRRCARPATTRFAAQANGTAFSVPLTAAGAAPRIARVGLRWRLLFPGVRLARRGAPVRCDTLGPRHERRHAGCALPGFRPLLHLGAGNPAARAFYRNAQAALPRAPGLPGGSPLRRVDRRTARGNRRRAQVRCKAELPPRPAGTDCDEYPFAAARARPDPFQVAWIAAAENRSAGAQLKQRWYDQRVLLGDPFFVAAGPLPR